MAAEINRPCEIIELPESDLNILNCPYCESGNTIKLDSNPRKIPDLGTNTI